MVPHDPLSSWFDDDEPRDDAAPPDDRGGPTTGPMTGAGDGRRRGIVVVGILAAVVWATAAALWLAGDDTPTHVPFSSTAPSGPAATPRPARSPTPSASPAPAGIDLPPAGMPDAAGAVAEISVHELVTGGGDERWVDAAALERWVPVPDATEPVAVGVVRIMLLEAGGAGWERRRQARYAVAVRCADECVAASDAWPLPLGNSPGPPDARPLGSAGDGYAEALLAAGYSDPAVEVLSEPLPGVVEVEVVGVPPGGAAAETHRVWLRTSPSPAVVGANLPPDHPIPDSRR